MKNAKKRLIHKKLKLWALLIICLLFSAPMKSQQLYVGANYHPHDDKNMGKIENDVKLMKEAGFTVVRMGHLAWDSYEPSDGVFDFAWFDKVMDKMDKAGIKVLLDIPVRPAPLWLHHKYPSIDITDSNGNRQYANHRYMDDIGDPDYQKYALRFVDAISRRYAKHPALLAFGIDNESGDGPISYSETAKNRFIEWVKTKYTTIDKLNEAWAGQRWSRRIDKFEEIGFPVSGYTNGAPERMLDFRRFVSDEINGFLMKVINLVNVNAPGVLLNTNAWYYSPLKYFDYTEIAYSGKMTREGCGFYPGSSLLSNAGIIDATFGIARIQFESNNPFWCSEFTTMTAVPGSMRKSAYATLMYGNQMVCGWTWQSMHGGEEQYLQGLLDWDGITNRKYDEYKKIATEFKKIQKYFPYTPKAEIGLAFSFPSQIVSSSFPEQHQDQLKNCFEVLFNKNIDSKILEISKSKLPYKLLIIPGVAVMDQATAAKIRKFVNDGGTVLMTSNSAIVDSTAKVFSSTRPGLLSDVFGIRVASFEETANINELSRLSFKGNKLEIEYNSNRVLMESPRYDVIEPKSAQVIANIKSLDKDYPIATVNRYGKGKAIYVGLPAIKEIIDPLVSNLIDKLSITKGPDVPQGVMARKIDNNHILYLNTTNEEKRIKTNAKAKSLLSDKEFNSIITIPPFEPEFIEIR